MARAQLSTLDPVIEERLTLESFEVIVALKAQSHKILAVLHRTSSISVNLLARSLRGL